MQRLVALVLAAMAVLVAGSVARSVLSRERNVLTGKVIAFTPTPGNESRNVPLPGEVTVLLTDGRTISLQPGTADEIRTGTMIRVSERIAPWGEVWYRMAR